MNYRKLGKTNLNISEISLGCSGFWGNRNFSEKKATLLINEAFNRGVNFFDTGHNYSNFNAEPRLGRILKNLLQTTDRSKIIISTKGGTTVGNASLFPKNTVTKDFSAEAIEKSIIKSINNLNCDYLDIFQLHGISASEINQQLIDCLLNLKQRGLFNYLGVNSHNEKDLEYISKSPEIFDMVLLDYNVLQLDRNSIIEKLANEEIGIIAGTVLAQGHLIKGKNGSIKTGSFFWYLARAILKSSSRQLQKNSKHMRETLSRITEMSPSQAAFSYILENKFISSCVFGTTNLNNLIEIIETSGKSLNNENKKAIWESYDSIHNKISN
ncbi:aldo/keto reductase [Flavobacterium piscis]|uniref:Aryl-alcohol dehydrogenase-like predicted oxidoreductase n=1 Tax=Flavobacterium piscis TaxID=1114874 RepID=A0ABU1Y340_9FLAO|nr:aldo/keto reductase [Flavobacterium piscis]MDR7208643.1 aryl-alcohol dehydrogenase-like predicted oxidoreductase [Flavobacterium piscis]